jgi:hypothetical protein
MPAAELVRLQQKSVAVLELLKTNLPENNGVKNAWKIQKAHSILCKVIVYYESLSCLAGPRISAPKDLKTVTLILSRRLHTLPYGTNNKKAFLTILRYHVSEGHLQYLSRQI